jgi:hypothetical protein
LEFALGTWALGQAPRKQRHMSSIAKTIVLYGGRTLSEKKEFALGNTVGTSALGALGKQRHMSSIVKTIVLCGGRTLSEACVLLSGTWAQP